MSHGAPAVVGMYVVDPARLLRVRPGPRQRAWRQSSTPPPPPPPPRRRRRRRVHVYLYTPVVRSFVRSFVGPLYQALCQMVPRLCVCVCVSLSLNLYKNVYHPLNFQILSKVGLQETHKVSCCEKKFFSWQFYEYIILKKKQNIIFFLSVHDRVQQEDTTNSRETGKMKEEKERERERATRRFMRDAERGGRGGWRLSLML